MDIDVFIDDLDHDLAWRKREVSELYMFCLNYDNEILRKSLLLIIYSHWEGFIKNSAKSYLLFVSELNIAIGKLTLNYKTISMKGLISQCHASNETLTLDNELNFMRKFSSKDTVKFKLPKKHLKDQDKDLINSKDNLSPAIFSNFCRIIGVKEKRCLDTKKHYFDEYFLNNRNAISHGSKVSFGEGSDFDLSLASLTSLKDIILEIMSKFQEDLKEYVLNKFYLSKNSEKKMTYDLNSDEDLDKSLKGLVEG